MQRNTAEKTFAQLIIIVGFVIMILGTYANLTAIDASQSGSHLREKPSIDSIPVIDHPKDTHNVQQVIVDEPKVIEADFGKKIEKPAEKIPEDAAKQDPVKADDKVEAVKDPQQEIQEKNEEIQDLKESKNRLEKEVLEMKEVLVKQNKETQDLVMQKFEEIAEKVEKIERQSADSGASVKVKSVEKTEEKQKLEHAEDLIDLVPLHEVKHNDEVKKNSSFDGSLQKNVDEQVLLKKADNDLISGKFDKESSKILIESAPESPKLVEESAKENSVNLIAKPKSDDKIDSKPVEPREPLEAKVLVNHQETRGDPIVKLIKSQDPLSYQIGEKMMESKKSNGSIELPKADQPAKHESSENEIKNEMRKKRDIIDSDALNDLGRTLQDFEFKSMITRDLKAIREET